MSAPDSMDAQCRSLSRTPPASVFARSAFRSASGNFFAIAMRWHTAIAQASHLTKLRFLNLSSNGLTEQAVRALSDAPHLASLEVLNLSGNGLDRHQVQSILQGSNHLQAGIWQVCIRPIGEFAVISRSKDPSPDWVHFANGDGSVRYPV